MLIMIYSVRSTTAHVSSTHMKIVGHESLCSVTDISSVYRRVVAVLIHFQLTKSVHL